MSLLSDQQKGGRTHCYASRHNSKNLTKCETPPPPGAAGESIHQTLTGSNAIRVAITDSAEPVEQLVRKTFTLYIKIDDYRLKVHSRVTEESYAATPSSPSLQPSNVTDHPQHKSSATKVLRERVVRNRVEVPRVFSPVT
ncbi:hypothetical protein QAD02_003723 [Eretmocerus hayati]|uniref:Uncharacterized protein n=1 Tax=Eretmocerus hayati TaxID=131215 RepID=A0ACC2NMZ3_9HYME|nr:hypothetical protein QAD02_003723 [Eretmocerus hayati]